jgi:hypothetical protein
LRSLVVREDTQSKLKPITKKKITQIPLHEKEKTRDEKEAADLYRQEVQQATVTEYNNTRVLPTINDPKIYSVRVRVSFFSFFYPSVDLNSRLFFL